MYETQNNSIHFLLQIYFINPLTLTCTHLDSEISLTDKQKDIEKAYETDWNHYLWRFMVIFSGAHYGKEMEVTNKYVNWNWEYARRLYLKLQFDLPIRGQKLYWTRVSGKKTAQNSVQQQKQKT